jgi:hypothetical protein
MSKTMTTSMALLLVAIAAHAADAPPQEPTHQSVSVPASSPAGASPLVCTRETPTGSTISHKVCRTQEQIDAEARLSDEAKRRIQYEAGVAQQQRMKGQ